MQHKTLSFAVAAVVGFGGTLALAPDAHAATNGVKALEVARGKKGAPYLYGAAGPSKFDCSGLLQWSYKQIGKKIPRVAADQYSGSTKIAAKNRKPGNLVFIRNRQGVYHAGFFAGYWDGAGWIYDAPRTGSTVGFHKLRGYTSGSSRWAVYGAR